MNSLNKSDNWQAEAPQLAQMEKKNPFNVPEGYFDTLGYRIQHRIENLKEENVNESLIRRIPLWTKYLAAACLTLVLGITLYLNFHQNEINFDGISDQEMISYLETHAEDSDLEFIFTNLEENPEILTENFNQHELETYLNQNL